jgi:hypothetical protein
MLERMTGLHKRRASCMAFVGLLSVTHRRFAIFHYTDAKDNYG